MDNASKALIMAGAILISVAIVGIGIYIFSAANSMTNSSINTMESTQVSMFNNEFYSYANDDDYILGTRAKDLIRHAKAVKVETSMEAADADPRTKYQVTYDYDDGTNGSGYITKVNFAQQ